MAQAPSDPPPVWAIAPISTPSLQWGAVRAGVRHECRHCGIALLTGEKSGFCCGPRGSRVHDVAPLPPLPPEYDTLIHDPKISKLSRKLNLIFSFASMESSHKFPQTRGGMLAVQGKLYHRVRPTHSNSAVRWLLYDSSMHDVSDAIIPHPNTARQLPPAFIEHVRAALQNVNPFVHAIRTLSNMPAAQYPGLQLVIADPGPGNEVAAIMSYENTTQLDVRGRRLVIERANGREQFIHMFSRLWEPLAYPLLFPHGTLGWGRHGSAEQLVEGYNAQQDNAGDADSPTTQIWHYRALLLREERFNIFGRLTNEYLVDMFSRNLDARLNYIRMNQLRLRQEDAALMGSDDDVAPAENIYLPASFLGSDRWAADQIADSLAIAANLGGPTFFITMTCTPDQSPSL